MTTLLKMATLLWNITPSRSLRERYFSVYCWLVRGKSRIARIDGVNFSLDLSQTIDVAFYLRRFEPELVAAIRTYTRPGDVILDIGANTGLHALAFANQVRPNGKVYAFEPTNYAYARLNENMRLNTQLNVEAVKLALSDENVDSQIIDFRSSWRTDGIIETKQNEVSIRKLDDWVADIELEKVNIIKLDVDGFEYLVLRGAIETLKRFSPLIFMEVGLYHFQESDKDPVTLLSDVGYRFWDAKTKESYSHTALRQCLSMPQMAGVTLNVLASADKTFAP